MGKNKKLITICAVCLLLLSMAVPTAFADTATSRADVDYGSSKMAYGGERTLYGIELNGWVQSETANTDTITGYMYTKGNLVTHNRDSATVSNTKHATLLWSNPDGHTGTFWAQCRAKSGNQGGYCEVYH